MDRTFANLGAIMGEERLSGAAIPFAIVESDAIPPGAMMMVSEPTTEPGKQRPGEQRAAYLARLAAAGQVAFITGIADRRGGVLPLTERDFRMCGNCAAAPVYQVNRDTRVCTIKRKDLFVTVPPEARGVVTYCTKCHAPNVVTPD